MNKYLQRVGVAVIAALLMPLWLHAQNDTIRTYTKEDPLIYEDAWDLYPYSFLDENKQPTGFNVELIRMLLDELDIPYEIRLKGRKSVLGDLTKGRADLTLGMDALFHDAYGHYGKTVVQLFTHSVASPKGQPVAVRTLSDLSRERVVVHRNSYSHHLMIDSGWAANAVPYEDMEKAVRNVSESGKGQIVWNTASLKWLISTCGADNLLLTPIGMPHGEYKFISNDRRLLTLLDSAYVELRSANKLEGMQARWFHPEYSETGIPSWVWLLASAMALLTIVLTACSVSYRLSVRRMQELARRRQNRLSVILQASHTRIWTYDIARQLFTTMDRNGRPETQCTGLEFARQYHPEDFHYIAEGIRLIAAGETNEARIALKAFDNETDSRNEREYVVMLSVLKQKDGKPSVIIGTKNDVTEEMERKRLTRLRLMRYESVFNTAMVDMVYYDENGVVSQMNERAIKTFGLTPEQIHSSGITLEGSIGDAGFRFGQFEGFYATCFLNPSENYRGDGNRKKEGTMYYEMQVVPIRTPSNRLLGAYGTGRDMTEVVYNYRKLKKGVAKLKEANDEVTEYVQNINYVFDVGGVRMANYFPDTHTLNLYKSLNVVQLALTQTRCMTIIDEKSKKTAMRMLNNMDNRMTGIIDAKLKTTLRHKGIPLYVHLRFIPVTDSQGHVESYFGMCRDISEVKNTEALLEVETRRAREVENLKNSFLRNMSYEIRTPLSTVVGFAELFEQEHQPEDEEVFIREIKNSSAHLLHLINDILFLSRLDAQMIEFNKQPIDFAQTFEGHCRIGWSNDMKAEVKYVVENPYEQLIVNIDDANIGRIIEQIASNSAQYTQSGMVRARYDYIGGKLMIAIDDTGNGMSADKLKSIYERFNSGNHMGTGLGLPICKQLVEQMGGSIDISSETGKGTTVWITLPCEAISMIRKRQV